MRKKHLAMIALCLLAIMLITPTIAYANSPVGDPKTGDPGVGAKDIQGLINFASTLLKYFSAFGGVIVVGALMYNGYKLASPNPQSRADAMQGFLYISIGGIVAFGSYYFAGLLKGIADTLH